MNWIDNADSYICPACGEEVSNPANLNFTCPKCGFVAEKDKPVVSKVMSEQRLIDANKLNCLLGIAEKDIYVKYWLDRMPTIDPETLPIVRELREKLMLTEANQNHFKEERDLLLFKTKETAEAATSEIDRRNKTICELQEKLERVTAERDNLNEEMKKYTQYINTQNPRIGRYEKLYNKIAAGCKLCRGLSSSSGVSPMCENGDPCPLNLDGDHP